MKVLTIGKIDTELFSAEFGYDFSKKQVNYNNKIDISNINAFTIGGRADCDISIDDEILGRDYIRVERGERGYEIDASASRYKTYVNGYQSKHAKQHIKNKTFLGIVGYNFFIDKNSIITEKAENVKVRLNSSEILYQKNHFKYPKFQKNARQQYILPSEKVEVLEPKALPAKPKKNFLLTILPMIVTMVLMVVVRGSMSGSGSNMYMIYMAGIMGVSVVVSIITYITDGKDYKKSIIKREDVYIDYIEKQEEKIEKLRDKERQISDLKYTTLEEKIRFAEDFDAKLFEKGKKHEDFLEVRIGKGCVDSNCPVEYKKEEYVETEDPLKDYPKLVHDKYKYIDEMPVILKLKELNAVGFVGKREKLYEMAKNMILSIAIEHFYQDVKLAFIADKEDEKAFSWIRWLKNLWNESFNGRNIIHDEESAKIMLEYLYSELNKRAEAGKEEFKENYVVFVYRSDVIAGHPVIKYVEKASELGFRFIFFEEYEEMLNEFCDYKVYLKSGTREGIIQNVKNGEEVQKFEYEEVQDIKAATAALKLGAVYIDEMSLESTLTKNITLYELLGIMNAEDLELGARWQSSKIYETMAAPLGVAGGDRVISLDLHEKFHGPHGLVAGTTGSGKSEILQSYILSMATLFHPYEVGFVIIDFKGGGMVNQFKELPHLNGAITNIDGREIDRSLKSIKAELQKRQRLFAQAEVNHIDDYIKAYKKGEAKTPLPHLILIVDEFAELKSEQPDFMKELISTARIGRSLGVHLILATQKPSGVVDAQIWSNSRFKLCLKVQDEADSKEVLKSPLAAEIREPGRAYLQVGNNEIFKLFQSAYSGAPARMDSMGKQKKYKICKVGMGGERKIIYEEKEKKIEDTETQLEVLVKYVQGYCQKQGIKKLEDICLPSLEKYIPFTIKDYDAKTKDICVPAGIIDDPSKQRQAVTELNLTQNNVMIVGSSQMGKTNLLQSIIKGLTSMYTSEEVNIYIIDFATMILKNMEKLNHVGGVVLAREDEKLKNFFKMLLEFVEERKTLMAELGLSSYSSYREAGYKEIPQIVIIIDNITAFKELFIEEEEILENIAREGTALGISTVIADSQTRGFGYKMMSNFSKRISLYCNESGEYAVIFDKTQISLENIAGRCLIEENREIYECQTYLAFSAEKETERIKQIREYIERINQKNKIQAKQIPDIPKEVTLEYIEEKYGKGVLGEKYNVAVGLDYATTETVCLNLLREPLVGIVGKGEDGKTNLVENLAEQLNRERENYPSEVYIIDDIEKEYASIKEKEIVKTYSVNPENAIKCLETVKEKLEKRYEEMLKGGNEEGTKEKMQIIIINSPEAYELIGENAGETFRQMVTKYKNQKICIMLTNVENTAIGYASPAPLKMFNETGVGVWLAFENLSEVKVADIAYGEIKEHRKAVKPGESYYIKGTEIKKIKTVQMH